jgi:XTP/dITP diphosphohydrolase
VKVYVCSSNPGKLREFALASSQANVQIEPLPGLQSIEPPAETGATFEDNAALKARFYSQFCDGLVLADDSGIEVEALNGEPGVYSARYAGPSATDGDNNHLLLERLGASHDRRARFVCIIALARADRLIGAVRGVVEGEIVFEPAGESGFGYDPLFFYPPLGRTFGQLSDAEKFAVSHRGRAFEKALELIGRLS